ncbi:MAG TPA: hypothetical protein H9836_10270 [Candidatus Nocardiopsis merdipullorum]|nr:hypothetical protein [Candidatus Nocardiopsis merdipullorum]
MTNWNVQPQEVGNVLSETAAHIGEEGGDGLLGEMDQLESRITSVNDHINSTPITIAIGEFSEHYFGLIGDMLSLTSNALQETSNAVTHYVNGQEEMALESQENAGVVPPPPPPPGSELPGNEARPV